MRRTKLIILAISISFLGKSQEINSIVLDEMINQNILYGYATIDVFSTDQFREWYIPEYNSYQADNEVIEALKPYLNEISIRVILATWCKDSKREVPRFFKIINSLNFSLEKVVSIGVNRKKICPEADVNQGYVDFVPTFILFRNGLEIGRIIEQPNVSLEEDMLTIVAGK